MYPISPLITVTLNTVPPLGRLAYSIDGVENNPTIELIRGYTYRFRVDAPSPYSFWIKTGLGLGQISAYNNGVQGNGSADILWRVPTNAPIRLAYQAYGSSEVSGSILLLDAPLTDPSGVDSYASLQQALDFLESSLSFSPKEIAGTGLVLTGNTLSLMNSTLKFLQDSNGVLYTTQSNFTVSDELSLLESEPTDLQSWLNYLAATIRQIKGTSTYTASNFTNLADLNSRIDNLHLELSYLNSRASRGDL
jgi:hypothetical protein